MAVITRRPCRSQRQTIRTDQKNGHAPAGDGLLADVEIVLSGVSAVFEKHGKSGSRSPLVDDLCGAITEEQVMRP